MPTAGKLVAGLLFAALMWYVSGLAQPRFAQTETLEPPGFLIINLAFGLVLGWRILGRRAGRSTWTGAISHGLTTTVFICFWALFAHSSIRVIQLSMRMHYEGPAEAVVDVFGQMWAMAPVIGTPEVLLTLLVGGMVTGLLAEWAGRVWR